MPNGIAYQFAFTRTTAVFLDVSRDAVLHTLWKVDDSSRGGNAETSVFQLGPVDIGVPISKEEFRRGDQRTALEDRVRQFLLDNADQAFTVYEISDELGFIESSPSSQEGQPDMQMVSIQVVLLKLFDNGIVESRIVDDGDSPKRYYRART